MYADNQGLTPPAPNQHAGTCFNTNKLSKSTNPCQLSINEVSLVGRVREVQIIHRKGNAIRRVKVLRLRHVGAAFCILVPRQICLHHALHGAVHVTGLVELGEVAAIIRVIPSELGYQALVGIPQHSEDCLVAEVCFCQGWWPVLGRCEVYRAAGDLRLDLTRQMRQRGKNVSLSAASPTISLHK